MSFEQTSVILKVGRDGEIRELRSNLMYITKDGVRIDIPIGFKTDLGSIPRVFQSFIQKDGKAMFAYILHDFLYTLGGRKTKERDLLLKEAMKSLGVGWWTVQSVYYAVRIGRWRNYVK